MAKLIWKASWLNFFSIMSDEAPQMKLREGCRTYIGRRWWHIVYPYCHIDKFAYGIETDDAVRIGNPETGQRDWFVNGLQLFAEFAETVEGKMWVNPARMRRSIELDVPGPISIGGVTGSSFKIKTTTVDYILEVCFTDRRDAIRFKLMQQ